MTAAVVERISNGTLSEANAWFQPPHRATSESAADFRSLIQRTLVASSFSRKPSEAALLPELEDTKINVNRRAEIIRQIDDAISAAFPSIAPPPTISLQPLQEWEGYVTEIGPETFTGRLVDVTARRKTEEEMADFPICDLSDDDRELLAPGAIFRWVIGYQRSKGGTKRRVSQITFRRLPGWTRKDLARAKDTAAELSREISWE
jgi:hypothetical protein